MKHTNRISAILFCTALLASACIEDIEYNGSDSKSMLVANCITRDLEIPVFHMTRSHSFLEYYSTNEDIKSGIDMTVDINGKTRKAEYDEHLGGYSDGRIIRQGDVISFNASHPEYGSISATDTVPYAQECHMNSYIKKYVHVKTISEAFEDYEPDFQDDKVDSSWVVELDIQGRPDATDYYLLKIEPVVVYTTKWAFDDNEFKMPAALHFKVPAATKVLLEQSNDATAILEETEEDSQFEYGFTTYMFSDQHIKDGSKLTFEILMEKPDTAQYIYYTNDTPDDDSQSAYPPSDLYSFKTYGNEIEYQLNIQLYVLSRSFYLYQESVSDYEDSDMTFMSEPVTIIHNVKGGAGILATYAVKDFSFGFKRPF